MDLLAQCASLANDYGATKGPNAAASFNVELWIGDPFGDGYAVPSTTVLVNEDTGEETTVPNGYAPQLLANNGANFPAPDPATGVLTTPLVSFPVSTAAYPDPVTHWLLRDVATGAAWDSGAFAADQLITVTAAGTAPACTLSIFYNPIPNGV